MKLNQLPYRRQQTVGRSRTFHIVLYKYYKVRKGERMSRPKPTVILEAINKITYIAEQVLASDGIYAVFYDGNPINLKTHNILVSYPGAKYKKSSHANRGHAINLCKKLNALFKTDKFTVVVLTQGEQVFP